VKSGVHVEVLGAGEVSRTTDAREHRFARCCCRASRRRRRRRYNLGRPQRCQTVAGDVWRAKCTVTSDFAESVSSGGVLALSDISQPVIQVC